MMNPFLKSAKVGKIAGVPSVTEGIDFLALLLRNHGIDMNYTYDVDMKNDTNWMVYINVVKPEEAATLGEERTDLCEAVRKITNEEESARFFINKETKRVYVCCTSIEDERVMFLVAAMLGSVFSKVIKFTEEEINMLMHVMRVEKNDIIGYIVAHAREFIKAHNLEILEQHKDFGKKSVTDALTYEIQQKIEEINAMIRSIQLAEEEKQTMEGRLCGMKYLGDEADGLYEYFRNREDILISDIDNNFIWFTVDSFLDSYDRDFAKQLMNSSKWREEITNSLRNTGWTDQNVHDFMKYVFVQRKYKIRGYSKFQLSPISVEAMTDDDFGLNATGYHNPHHYYHRCLGNNNTDIIQCLKRGDFIAAIEYCCGCTRQMNLAETSITFNKLVVDIFKTGNTKKFLIDKDGNAYTLQEMFKKEETKDGEES